VSPTDSSRRMNSRTSFLCPTAPILRLHGRRGRSPSSCASASSSPCGLREGAGGRSGSAASSVSARRAASLGDARPAADHGARRRRVRPDHQPRGVVVARSLSPELRHGLRGRPHHSFGRNRECAAIGRRCGSGPPARQGAERQPRASCSTTTPSGPTSTQSSQVPTRTPRVLCARTVTRSGSTRKRKATSWSMT